MAKIDCRSFDVRQINTLVKEIADSDLPVTLENPDARHLLCVGMTRPRTVRIAGSAGYFAGGLSDGIDLEIENNAGWGVADNLMQGKVVVRQSASAIAGVAMRGGEVVVHGNLGSRAGQVMKGGILLSGGSAGFMAGYLMMGGILAICGDAGDKLGQNIIAGSIYVGGSISSLGDDAEVADPFESELDILYALLDSHGIPAPKKFQRVCSSGKLHHYKSYEKAEDGNGSTRRPHSYPIPDGPFWNRSMAEDIAIKASIGRYRVRGFGAQRPLPTLSDIGFRFAPERLRDLSGVRSVCNLRTTLGGKFGGKPLELAMPILIAPMSFGALSKNMKIALAKASTKAGIAANTGEGGMLPEEREFACQLIYQCLSGRFGFNPADLQKADAVEIYISQGAKPGLGGQLMGKKITPEIAELRGLPTGIDLRSPSRHPDVMGADDLVIKIHEFREATSWKVPVSLKLGAGRLKDDIKIALKDEVDFVQIDGMEGGTGASPDVVTETVGIPTLAAIVQATRGLKEMDADGKLPIVLMGGIRDGLDAAKAISLGATAVSMGTALLVAAGCTACRQCHSGICQKGIAAQDQKLVERLDPDMAADRIARFLEHTATEMAAIALAAGKADIHDLSTADLVALTPQAAAITGLPLQKPSAAPCGKD